MIKVSHLTFEKSNDIIKTYLIYNHLCSSICVEMSSDIRTVCQWAFNNCVIYPDKSTFKKHDSDKDDWRRNGFNDYRYSKEDVRHIYLLLVTSYCKHLGKFRFAADIKTLGASLVHVPRTIDFSDDPEIQYSSLKICNCFQ